MLKTPISTVIGGAGIWTPGCTVIGGQQNIDQLIKSIFSDGTQGLYLNAQDALSVSDLSSIKDLSGRNNHATQLNATSRASLITDPSGYKSLKFDGVDDYYVTQSIDFTSTDKVTVIAAIKVLAGSSSTGFIVELSNSLANNNSAFSIVSGSNYQLRSFSKGTIGSTSGTGNSYPSPQNLVISSKMSISQDLNTLKVNNSVFTSTGDQGTGTYGNYPLYIGRRGGVELPFGGQIYSLLVIGKLLDDATIQRIEKEFAKYIGVTL